uniref:RING-type E3 ubiquitin transferase n=1 Tax=Leersia perrieri TaxID=77586 RepID=A0A0D9VVE1_9ORYZ
MPPTYRIIKVARDEDFRSRIGEDGHYFDLVDFRRIEGFRLPDSLTISSLKSPDRFNFSQAMIARKFGTPVQCQRLWRWTKRNNKTYRINRPLTAEEEDLSVLHPHSLQTETKTDHALVFLKLFDPEKAQLRYVGSLYVNGSSMPSEILPKLRSLAGFSASETIELYEEIKFDPSVMCEPIDIDLTFSASEIITGDIICYQKSPPQNWGIYSSVASFLQHVCDHKKKWKRRILEEEIASFKLQADTDRLKKEETMTVNELLDQSSYVFLDFSPEDLEQAADHFNHGRKVGDTEYGQTYKGMIHNNMVAIKLSSSQSLFLQEVSVLRQWRHPNIISFIGVCTEISVLVYEWVSNGNLEDRIVCTNDSPPLSWHIRTQIIGDICCALLFLHSNKPTALVHGDLRPCNILIDANYRSKLCNIGMSNLFVQPGSCPPNLMERLPYMDPEFNFTGEITALSDVYSLGVIILRLLTGMAPYNLSKKVAESLEGNSLPLLIDKSAGDWPYIEAKQLAVLGLSCVEMTRDKRPDLLNKVWKVVQPLMRKHPAASWPYIQSTSVESSAPAPFICPIRMEIMKDPQVASDGFTYEAEAIGSWFDRGNSSRSPMTNLPLPNLHLIPNRVLCSSIQEYIQQQQHNGWRAVVVTEEDFRSRIGKHGHYFDLIDFNRIDGFNVRASTIILNFKSTDRFNFSQWNLAAVFGTPVHCQRLWLWSRRQNKTYRVIRPLTIEEEKLSVLRSHSLPIWSNRDDALLFIKYYDQEHSYGQQFFEIQFEPSVMCEPIDIHKTFSAGDIGTGDIICYRKIKKPKDLPKKYISIEYFLHRVCGQEMYEEERKVHILEEEIVALKRQAETCLLQKEEALTACDQFKHERDNAVRQVNELRDQRTHVILNFSRKDLEQATQHFSNAGKVSILGQWRHPNIITFIGVCSETSALVYEWLPNGNLEDRIVRTNDSPPLSWHNRTRIIGEICCALLFLHSNKPIALVHGDLRPCNILIDANYRSKLCNIVMYNLFLQPGSSPPNLTERLPYMEEYVTTGELTTLSDVYSLGVIILRLLTGMPPLNLLKKVAESLKDDSLHLLIDKFAGDWPYIEAKQLAVLGLSCAEMTREKRPDLLNKVWKEIQPLMRKPPAASWSCIQSASTESSTPAPFVCPISMDIMKDPQVASDGFTYEAEAIKCWFDRGYSRSPMTNLPLPNLNLIPNRILCSSIQEYLEQQQ